MMNRQSADGSRASDNDRNRIGSAFTFDRRRRP